MGETDYKILLQIYQQKTFDLFNQVIALEARVINYTKNIESLQEKLTEVYTEIERRKIQDELEEKKKKKIGEKKVKLENEIGMVNDAPLDENVIPVELEGEY
jgi:regulator of replication initiation timing